MDFKCEIKDFYSMWALQDKIIKSDQKKIIGKTFVEIADILDISQEEMFKLTEFNRIGAFTRSVQQENRYSKLSVPAKEIYDAYLSSNRMFKALHMTYTVGHSCELAAMLSIDSEEILKQFEGTAQGQTGEVVK